MKEKLIALWRKVFPAPIDTNPDHFNAWFQHKLGQQLKGGDVYYAVKIKGCDTLPDINKKFQVFCDLENAQRKKNSLTRDNPGLKLEIVIIRAFYSYSEV